MTVLEQVEVEVNKGSANELIEQFREEITQQASFEDMTAEEIKELFKKLPRRIIAFINEIQSQKFTVDFNASEVRLVAEKKKESALHDKCINAIKGLQ